jgi:hypothetical protein
MKPFFKHSLLFIFIAGFSSLLKADLTINMESSHHEMNINSTMKISSGNFRMDADTGSVIFLSGEKKMIVLMPQQKKYMVMTSDYLKSVTGQNEDKNIETPEFIRTGKTETINGFNCEQVIIKMSNGQKSELWVSKTAPSVLDFAKSMSSFSSSQSSKMGLSWLNMMNQNKDLSTFPIRTISFDPNGSEIGRMTVTSFSEGKVSSSEFIPPSDYTEMQMPNMPGMNSAGSGGSSGLDLEAMKKMQQQMMKGGKPSQQQIEQLKKMAEEMQKNQGQ